MKVEIPKNMAETISEIVSNREDLAYESVDGFVKEAVRSNLSKYEETIEGHKQRAEKLRWPNPHPPFGYDLDEDGRLEINEREAEYVREMFKRYRRGDSYKEIAEWLNERGVRTKRGNEFCPRAVGDILKNEIYIGIFEVSETKRELKHLKIVSEDLFDEVQSKIEERRKGLASRFDGHRGKRSWMEKARMLNLSE